MSTLVRSWQGLRALLFYLIYGASVVVHSTFMLSVSRFIRYETRYRLLMIWNRFAIAWLRVCCGVRSQVEGLSNLPEYPVIVVSNHQSAWETIYLPTLFPHTCTLLKRELLRIPFFGWALSLMRPVAIDRSNPRDALRQMLSVSARRLETGSSVLIFPEGTRVAPGTPVRFARGAGQLAAATGAHMVCVAHNAGECWPPKRLGKRPGTVRIAISEPFHSEGRSAAELTEAARSWIQAKLDAFETQR